jgi:hypothetical protein
VRSAWHEARSILASRRPNGHAQCFIVADFHHLRLADFTGALRSASISKPCRFAFDRRQPCANFCRSATRIVRVRVLFVYAESVEMLTNIIATRHAVRYFPRSANTFGDTSLLECRSSGCGLALRPLPMRTAIASAMALRIEKLLPSICGTGPITHEFPDGWQLRHTPGSEFGKTQPGAFQLLGVGHRFS